MSAAATFDAFLTAQIQAQIALNDAEAIAAATRRDGWMLEKVENFRRDKLTAAEAAAVSTDDLLARIASDPIVRAMFRKEPGRQSVHEKAQIEWIRTHGFPDLVKPNAGRGGTYFTGGTMSTSHVRPPSDATKTLDIHSAVAGMWGVLKYSTTEGGAQDNQFRDVQHFIREMIACLRAGGAMGLTFRFYLDGPYYTERKYTTLRDMVPGDLADRIVIGSAAALV